jgi:hypothetical protein
MLAACLILCRPMSVEPMKSFQLQEARSMHAVHGLRAPWRGQERKAQCKGAEPLRPNTQVKMVKKVNTCNNTIVNYN